MMKAAVPHTTYMVSTSVPLQGQVIATQQGWLTIGPLDFKPGDLFHGLVTTFVAATAGFTAVFDGVRYPDLVQATGGRYPGRIADEVRWHLGKTVGDIRGGAITSGEAEQFLWCMLAISAWAQAEDTVRSNNGPLA